MALAFIQSANGSGVATGTAVTGTFTSTTGNAIIVACGGNSATSNDITSVTDSKGNTYSRAKSQIGSSMDLEIWYSTNITGGASHTVTATSGNAFRNVVLVAQEFSGVALSSAFDQTAGANGTSAAPSSGATPTTTQADELVIAAAVTNDSSHSYVVGSGYGHLITQVASTTGNHAVEDKVVAATGTQTATFTLTSAVTPYDMAIATFKADSSATTTSTSSTSSSTSTSSTSTSASTSSTSSSISTSSTSISTSSTTTLPPDARTRARIRQIRTIQRIKQRRLR